MMTVALCGAVRGPERDCVAPSIEEEMADNDGFSKAVAIYV